MWSPWFSKMNLGWTQQNRTPSRTLFVDGHCLVDNRWSMMGICGWNYNHEIKCIKHTRNIFYLYWRWSRLQTPPTSSRLLDSAATICCPRASILEGASSIKFSTVSNPFKSKAPIPSGILSHVVIFIPTPGIAFFRRYETQCSTTSGSASHALIARLWTFRSKFSCDFLWAKGLRMTVHKDRCVGSGITLDAGMPREDAAWRAKCVKSLRRGIWCERKWILATGIPCVRGCKWGAKTLRPWTSVIAYSSSLTLSLAVSSLSRGKLLGSYLGPNVAVDL